MCQARRRNPVSKLYTDSHLGVDVVQAAFWNGPLSRLEAQKVFDDYAKVTIEMKEQLLKLDFAVGYLLEKFDVKPEDVKLFMDKKMIEYAEQLKAQEAGKDAAPAPPEPSRIIT
jgi:hypothetical protein